MRHLEPVRSAVFLIEARAISKPSCLATFVAFWAAGAVEIGDVLVADIAEPRGTLH